MLKQYITDSKKEEQVQKPAVIKPKQDISNEIQRPKLLMGNVPYPGEMTSRNQATRGNGLFFLKHNGNKDNGVKGPRLAFRP